ncbi:energy transducer TonB [Methylophaga sp. 41_12_T18]|nr:energy transducer TonB [Methylophaga sp. 41_12_T18]
MLGSTTAVDRLIFTLLFSVIFHLVLVLGVTFSATSPPTNEPIANLEITLVKQQTDLAPEQADFLAQANNEGGGETDKKAPEPTPDAPVPEAKEAAAAENTPPQQVIAEPTPIVTPTPLPPVIEAEVTPQVIETPPPPKVKPAKPAKVITQAKAERKIVQVEDAQQKVEKVAEIIPETKPRLSASELMFQAKNEIIRLEKKFEESRKVLSKRPKKRRLSSRTKEYAAAAYHEGWRKKVERIGNLNYPQEAKRKRINGSLMLSVDINPDGSVGPDGIVVSRSSGHKVLDDAAIKIVRLAAPYAAIPENVLQGYDMITIIRTWKFETDRGLLSR